MGDARVETNKNLARQFVDALNRRDLDRLGALLHPDFIWITAVIGDDEPNEMRPLQSEKLKGTNLPHQKPRLDRAETLALFQGMFRGHYHDAFDEAQHPSSGEAVIPRHDDDRHQRIDILSVIGEADRVAMEAESNGAQNPENGRYYNNFYHYAFTMKDGRILLFKEYQDTLHIYDFLSD